MADQLEIGDTVRGMKAYEVQQGKPGIWIEGTLEKLSCPGYGIPCYVVGGYACAAATCSLVRKAEKLPKAGDWVRVTDFGDSSSDITGGKPILVVEANACALAKNCVRIEFRDDSGNCRIQHCRAWEPAAAPLPKAGQWVTITKATLGTYNYAPGVTLRLDRDARMGFGSYAHTVVFNEKHHAEVGGYEVLAEAPKSAAIPAADSWVKVAKLWPSPVAGDFPNYAVGDVLQVRSAKASDKGPQWAYVLGDDGSVIGEFEAMPALPAKGSWLKITDWGDAGEVEELNGVHLKVASAEYDADGEVCATFEDAPSPYDDEESVYFAKWEPCSTPRPAAYSKVRAKDGKIGYVTEATEEWIRNRTWGGVGGPSANVIINDALEEAIRRGKSGDYHGRFVALDGLEVLEPPPAAKPAAAEQIEVGDTVRVVNAYGASYAPTGTVAKVLELGPLCPDGCYGGMLLDCARGARYWLKVELVSKGVKASPSKHYVPKPGELVRVLEMPSEREIYGREWRGVRPGSKFYVFEAMGYTDGTLPTIHRDSFSGGISLKVEPVAAKPANEVEPNRPLKAGEKVRILETRKDLTGAPHKAGDTFTLLCDTNKPSTLRDGAVTLSGRWHYVMERTTDGYVRGSTARVEVIS